jgi:hypothetical protein
MNPRVTMGAGIIVLLAAAALGTAARAADTPPGPGQITVTGNSCALNGTLELKIENLGQWLENAKKDAAKLVLYLQGAPMRGMKPRVDAARDDVIRFYLDRDPSNEENRKAWDTLLSHTHGGTTRTVDIAVGFEGELPHSATAPVELQVIDSTLAWVFFGIMLILVIVLVCLAKKKNLLRDGGPIEAGSRPYSLAKTQMSFWGVLVFAAFLFVWMATGRYEPLSPQVLGLMGISAVTGLSAVAIGSAKREQAKTDIAKLQAEQATLETAKNTVAAGTFPAASQARIDEIAKSILELKKETITPPSDGFVNDLLTDVNGLSFHRLQIVIWTLVLGVTFCVSVYNVLSMPAFPETLLVLMGISNGTYIGFKFSEKQA